MTEDNPFTDEEEDKEEPEDDFREDDYWNGR